MAPPLRIEFPGAGLRPLDQRERRLNVETAN